MILTMRCDQASSLISKSQEAPLNRAEAWALRLHLLGCRMCRKYRTQLALMRNMLGRLTDPHTYQAVASSLLDEDQARILKRRLLQKIRKNLDST